MRPAAKKLSEVTHRTTGGEQKRRTFVIDFANEPEDGELKGDGQVSSPTRKDE